jgi:4'-phosphopantetheinyl transferase
MTEVVRVDVWTVDLEQPAGVVDALAAALSADEKERAARFHFEPDRRHFIVARASLRHVLAARLGGLPGAVAFDYGMHGKPSLAAGRHGGTPLRFNLSHAHGCALIAVCEGRELGVDIEYMGRDLEWDDIARRFFAPEESSAILALPPPEQLHAFFRCWTRKEAYIKARGDGMTLGLAEFAVTVAPGAPVRLLRSNVAADEVRRWSLRDVPVAPGYAACLAVECPCPDVRLHAWSPPAP